MKIATLVRQTQPHPRNQLSLITSESLDGKLTMTEQNKVFSFPSKKRIEAQAAEWVLRMDRGPLAPLEFARFQSWMSRSEFHRQSAERLAKAWGLMDELSLLDDLANSDDVTALLKYDRQQSSLKLVKALGAVAALLIMCVATWTGNQIYTQHKAHYEAVYVTAVGDVRNVDLPDGSIVRVNTNSKIEINFERKVRNVKLVYGEAFFEVAHAANRPFLVNVGDRQIKAVGTAFNVRLNSGRVAVTVEEGRVALLSSVGISPNANHAMTELTQISAGQYAIFDKLVEKLEIVSARDIQRQLSWRAGMLSFSGEPLSYMIEEVSRYSNLNIEIADDSLREMPIAGYFKVGEVEAMLEVLELMSDVKVERLDQGHIRLTKQNK